jgi:hypothetical protein
MPHRIRRATSPSRRPPGVAATTRGSPATTRHHAANTAHPRTSPLLLVGAQSDDKAHCRGFIIQASAKCCVLSMPLLLVKPQADGPQRRYHCCGIGSDTHCQQRREGVRPFRNYPVGRAGGLFGATFQRHFRSKCSSAVEDKTWKVVTTHLRHPLKEEPDGCHHVPCI